MKTKVVQFTFKGYKNEKTREHYATEGGLGIWHDRLWLDSIIKQVLKKRQPGSAQFFDEKKKEEENTQKKNDDLIS